MGTRGWTLSTFLGCCVWILHGLGAAAAIPVATEGPFTMGTAPITAENERPRALMMGTAETSTMAADAETDESIFMGSLLNLTFPPKTEPDSFASTMSEYGSTVTTLMNMTKPLNNSQNIEGNLAAPTTAATITAQHPALTPEAEYDVIETTPDPTLGTTLLFADTTEDILAAVPRGEDINLTTGTMSLPTTPPLPDTWVPQPTAGSPMDAGVTVLPSQGMITAMGVVEEGVTLPTSVQNGANANSLSPSPSTGELLMTQQDGVVSGVEGINPEPAGEMIPAAEESPLASESGDAGGVINGEFSTTGSSYLTPESPVTSGTAGNPGEPSLLPGQAALSPDATLVPSSGGDGDMQGIPGMSSESSGSTLSPATSKAPVAPEETEDTATSLLAPEVPTDAQSDMNLPVSATGDMGSVGLDNPSLQPVPWQTTTREQPPLLPDVLTSPMDTTSAPGPAYPPPGAGSNPLPAADGAAETSSSSGLTAVPEASVSLRESQPGVMPDGAPQEADGPGTGLSSDSDAPSSASFVPGLAWSTAGVQGQGTEGAEDMAQAGGPTNGRPYTDTQSDISPSALQPSASPANNGDLLTGGTGDLANAELSLPSAFGDGAGGAPTLGQVSTPGPAAPSSAGLEADLSGAERPGNLPSESASAPGAVYPLPGSVAGPVSGAETAVSPDLSAGQGAPGSPSFGGSQPWGTAAGAPQEAGFPGAKGPDAGLTSAWDVPSSAVHGPVGPPSPALVDQLGTNLGPPAAEEQGAGTAEQALEGAGSGIDSEPSLSSTAGSGMSAGIGQLPSASSSSSPASPSDVVAAPSVSRGDEAGSISAAAPGPDSLSPVSPDSETGPGLGLVEGAESAKDVAHSGNPESAYVETSPSAFSPWQDSTNTGELPAGETGSLVNTEQSLPSASGDEVGAGGAPAQGQVSSPGPVPPSSAGLEADLSGAERPGNLPSESASAPGAVYPLPGSVAGPVSGAETAVSPDLSASQGAPGSPSFGGSQPWGTAAGAPQEAGFPGAKGPDAGLTSAWDVPSSVVHGPVGPPSPAFGDQLGTNLGPPAAEEQGAGTAEQALEGAGSGIDSEPSLSSTAGSGMSAGIGQLPSASSSSSPASPSDVVAAPSVSRGDEAGSISAAAPGPDSLSPVSPDSETGPGLGLVEGAESAKDVAHSGNPESAYVETSPSAFSPLQDQLPSADLSSGPVPPRGEVAASSLSGPSSPSALGGVDSAPGALQPSLGTGPGIPAAAGEGASEGTADEASLAGGGGASGVLDTGLEAAGPQEAPVSAPGIKSDADIGLSGGKQSQADVVDVPGGASVNSGPSPAASLVPMAPDNSGISDSRATSTAASLLLPGHGLNSGLAPNGDLHSAPGTQSGSSPLVPEALGGLAGDAGGISWSLEDELASGMPAPLGEGSPHAPTSPNAAPVMPPAPQRGNAAEGTSVSPGPFAPLAARESIVGSSAGGKGELGASLPGGPAFLLPPCQPGNPGASSRDADSPVPGKASAVLLGVTAGQEDIGWLLPSPTGSGADIKTLTPFPLEGSPGLPALPPTGITAGSTGSKIPSPSPTGGSSLQPIRGSELTTSLASGAPATARSNLPGVFPGQGGSQGGSPATACPGTSCSLVPVDPAPPAPFPREVLPRPGAATVTSHTSLPVVPAPPGRPAVVPTQLPSPSVPAVPLYGYGARENDQEYVERRVDFNSPLFKPDTGFPFGKTLRDSLYFTDNGQIIFPASDKGIFTYPNPPPSGFNGHEEVPMIAIFWDNADFSRGVGTTFYQEFSTLNTAKPPFVRDVEAKVRRYMRSSYSAAWTLKITWEKAPVYSSRTDTQKTITYQAVLTTDGFRSYILMLYQDRGMQWDYTRLAATNVLIGYTSGDGFYHNDDLTKRPPAAKYRPDQFRGYNTDLRGLWIYRLESRVGINYRLKCLAWTGQQQEPRTWSQGLPTCPCSLQQGQQDPRFKSSRGGRWAARVSMLHSASPNQHGAGVRCLYDSQNQLIEGRQERYWRSSRQASPYRDQELKLYDWCCNRAGSAHLCARYSEKRPKIGCDGYQSPGTGSSEEVESDSDEQIDGEDK